MRVIIALLLGIAAPAAAQERVELPLTLWTQVQDALRPPPASTPTVAFSTIARRLEGAIRDDVLRARFDVRFEVFAADGWLEIPVLDGAASLKSVTLNGAPAVLRKAGDTYVVGVRKPGAYHLEAQVIQRADDIRSVGLALPPGGPVHVAITVPEAGIRAALADGVVTAQIARGQRTRVEGEANNDVRLSWTRAGREDVASETAMHLASVFTVNATVIRGLTEARVEVKSGAVDRVTLPVPPALEVVDVQGDDVLQWRTIQADGQRTLTVLLTHLVEADFTLSISTQQAVADPLVLRGLSGPKGSEGHLGVLARTGLDVKLRDLGGADRIRSSALPPAVTQLTDQPLLFGARFEDAPALGLDLVRNEAVPLVATIVDALEGSTLLLEDGAEISKIRLHMRNNARQHLAVTLPVGAQLSHALIEGVPIQPARDGERLLIPLRQSTQNTGGRYHVVQPGENLGEIAYIYYSNPRHWQRILNANDTLYEASDVAPGMRLRVPAPDGVEVEESRFVVELAWRIDRDPLGAFGQRAIALAALDVDVVEASWHVYLPKAVRPLRFETAFEQRSARRTAPLDRLQRYIRRAIVGQAEAGGLAKRKAMYQAEARSLAAQRGALGVAPVVGTRYRFRQLMLGRDVPTMQVAWLSESAVTALHWGAVLWAALVVLIVLRPRSGLLSGVIGLAALAPLFWAGYHVVGVNRHLIWGLDLGLALLFARHRIGPWRAALITRLKDLKARPLLDLFSIGNLLCLTGLWAMLAAIVAWPALCSLGLLIGLTLAWIRSRQAFVPRVAQPV